MCAPRARAYGWNTALGEIYYHSSSRTKDVAHEIDVAVDALQVGLHDARCQTW
jgi:hypothetical protein